MSEEQEAVTVVEVPIYLKYNFTAGAAPARFLTQIKKGVLTGQRCPKCSAVYVPPRGSCAGCGVPTEEEVVLSDKATVQSFTIVNIPIPNNPIQQTCTLGRGCRRCGNLKRSGISPWTISATSSHSMSPMCRSN
jgi:hypothetical protein